MIRKLVIAFGASAVIAGAALAPTAASAGGWKHKHHGWHGWDGGIGIYTPAYFGPYCYRVNRLVLTPFGYKVRRVTVCE